MARLLAHAGCAAAVETGLGQAGHKDAYDALVELSVLRQGIEMFRPSGKREKQFGRMLIAALEVGYGFLQVQVRPFEPPVLKAKKAIVDREKASLKKAANFAERRQYTIDAALTVWSEASKQASLTFVRDRLHKNSKVRERFPDLPKSLRTIEKFTVGLVRPATSPKLR